MISRNKCGINEKINVVLMNIVKSDKDKSHIYLFSYCRRETEINDIITFAAWLLMVNSTRRIWRNNVYRKRYSFHDDYFLE